MRKIDHNIVVNISVNLASDANAIKELSLLPKNVPPKSKQGYPKDGGPTVSFNELVNLGVDIVVDFVWLHHQLQHRHIPPDYPL